MNARRDVVAVYGSCQAQVLAYLSARIPSLARRFAFITVTDTVEPGARPQPFPGEAERAVLVWEQFDQRPHLQLRDELRARVAPGTPTYRFPGMSINALWPFRVKDARNRPEPSYPWGRFPIGDRIALEVAALGLSGERAFAEYIRRSNGAFPDINHILELERAVARTRDASCDVGMSDFLFGRFRDTYLFWTFGHLGAPVYRELILRLLECSAAVIGNLDDAMRREIDTVIGEFPGQGELQLPVHPLVIERLGLRYLDTKTRYRWFDQRWTFEEYMTRYIEFDSSW